MINFKNRMYFIQWQRANLTQKSNKTLHKTRVFRNLSGLYY